MENLNVNFEIGLNRVENLIDDMVKNGIEQNSQNLLVLLSKFVEVLLYKIYVKLSGSTYDYCYQNYRDYCNPFMSKRRNKYKELLFFHELLNITSSHYFVDENSATILMRKYYDYLINIKKILKDEFNLDAFYNIDKIEFNDEMEFKDYYEKILFACKNVDNSHDELLNDKYYVLSEKMVKINNERLYEITLINALFTNDKYNRFIVFSRKRINTNYAVNIYYKNSFIEIENNKVPIKVVFDWNISIRECEFKKFFKILGMKDYNVTNNKEYYSLMKYLKDTNYDLLDIALLDIEDILRIKNLLVKNNEACHIFECIIQVKKYIYEDLPGSNLLKYILFTMNNDFIKSQYNENISNPLLSNLYFCYESIPFDNMPLALSPKGHILSFSNLIKVFSVDGREHELLAHIIQNNTENKNRLYTSDQDLNSFADIDNLIRIYNEKLYYKHKPNSELVHNNGFVYFYGKEKDTLDIIIKLKELSDQSISNHQIFIDEFLNKTSFVFNYSEEKIGILKILYKDTRVSLISGPAGTGKSTFIKLVYDVYQTAKVKHLFLAQTNSAVNNLKKLINNTSSDYYTISSFLDKETIDDYSIVFIDECSIISNKDMIKLMNKLNNKFVALLLSGDEYQIESIAYGNWFRIAKSVLKKDVVHELKGQHRTKDEKLLNLWNSCRFGDGKTLDLMCGNHYHSEFNKQLFARSPNLEDEIVLCLNYDGLYGVNNLNALFQSQNPARAYSMKDWTFKVGDPILFNDSNRFSPVIYNNLKGIILGIEEKNDRYTFKIKIDKVISFFEEIPAGLEECEPIDGKSVVKFDVFKHGEIDSNYEIDDTRKIIPFQVAYVITIHKAQGLEFSSVKVVLSESVENNITPNIFYTAITRTKNKLKVYCTNKMACSITKKIENEYNDVSDIKIFKRLNYRKLF